MKWLLGLLSGVLVLVLLGGAVAYGGLANVAASGKEAPAVRWFLRTTRENAVRRAAADVAVPALGAHEQILRGVRHFQAMCVSCHGAPGIEPSEIGRGLQPAPPDLTRGRELGGDPARDYWVVAHGIRMTGMPAFGPTHDERDLWALVALLRELPATTPDEYAAWVHEAGGEHEHEHGEEEGAHTDGGAEGAGAGSHDQQG